MTTNSMEERARAHGLGRNAVEIEDPDFTSAFVAFGSLVYFDQPGQGGDGLVVLGREAAVKLAHTILAAFAAQPDGMVWRDIASAPKDGAPVLIWKPDERAVGEYMMAAYWADDHYSGVPGWVPVGGHSRQGYYSKVAQADQGYPTHWMPLPSGPAMVSAAVDGEGG